MMLFVPQNPMASRAEVFWSGSGELLPHRLPTATQCIVAQLPFSEAQTLLPLIVDVPVVFLLDDFTHALAASLRAIGAFEVLPKGIAATELSEIIGQACAMFVSRRPAPITTSSRSWRGALIGNCPAMESLADAIALIAERRSTVLITGETGTGKEVVARALHQASGRKGPLVSINCAALPEALLEAELFGHTKGAFTGAQQARVGRFEAAQRGSIFLDEIGEMPLDLQAKLLRVLQEREIQRLGSSETVAIDVRIIAATNADLLSKVEDGRFRQDLYFRLNVVPIHLPPLRERSGDLARLAHHFVTKICTFERLPLKTISRAALARLEAHNWPGNIRELENTIERAIALSGHNTELAARDFMLPLQIRSYVPEDKGPIEIPEAGLDFEQIVAGIERGMIEQALRRTNGNKSAAADLLRLKRTTLGAKMRTLGHAQHALIA